MSSQEDLNDSDCSPRNTNASQREEKKKRVRACDNCRRRKVRCDGDRQTSGVCTNCKAGEYACTYAPKKRSIDPEYVQNLESQLAQAQDALRKLSAKIEAGSASPTTDTPSLTTSQPSPSPSLSSGHHECRNALKPTVDNFLRVPKDDVDLSDDEFSAEGSVEGTFRKVFAQNAFPQFLGKSSVIVLLQQALNMQVEYTGMKLPLSQCVFDLPGKTQLFSDICGDTSRDYPWFNPSSPFPYTADSFPETDLMCSLLDLFFVYSNLYLPVLHRGTFENSIRDKLHLRNEGFGSTVLLVCAIGARFSEDPRVLSDGSSNGISAGWKYFERVQSVRRAMDLQPPTVYDLQVPCLAAHYLYGSPAPQSASAIVAFGLRLAMELGAHRRKIYKPYANADDELLKRAFWSLVALDRLLSSALGRPCTIQDEDYDVEFLLECDDEYWFPEDPRMAFSQPPGKPSKIVYFNQLIRLQQIHACALRTIYATSKSKAYLGLVGKEWEQHVVSELDSSLNRWVDSMPEHLKWDPNMTNLDFMNQSALLYSTYHNLRIIVHRSFIPLPHKSSTTSFPSLTICTSAARSCIHILHAIFRRDPIGIYQNLIALFNSGIVLILNIWACKHSGTNTYTAKDINDVQTAIAMIRALQQRCFIADRTMTCMTKLLALGDVQLPQDPIRHGVKRTRDMDTFDSVLPGLPVDDTPIDHRTFAGAKRVQQHRRLHGDAQPLQSSSRSSSFSFDPFTASHMQASTSPGSPQTFDKMWQAMAAAGVDPLGLHDPPLASGFPESSMAGSSFTQHPITQVPSSSLPFQHVPPQRVLNMPADAAPQDWNASDGMTLDDAAAAAFNNPQLFDSDVLAMLSSAPMNIEWNDWGTYMANLSDINNVRDIQSGISQL